MTWNEILSEVRFLAERFRADGSVPWFRGHRCATWELKSVAHRNIERLTDQFAIQPPESDLVGLLREESKTLYRRFKADAWSLLQDRERSDWAILFTMQHFGIPTRLLDWTESFACAVFFAQLSRARGEAAAIWVLDPQALNQASLGKEGILALDDESGEGAVVDPRAWHPKWKGGPSLPTIAAAPIFTNPRMVSQQSVFILAGDTFLPIDDQFAGLVLERRLVKIILSAETFDDAEDYLATAGITAFNYYPDLEGLALKHRAQVERTVREARKLYPQFFSGDAV